jgi:hypothetical protein
LDTLSPHCCRTSKGPTVFVTGVEATRIEEAFFIGFTAQKPARR